MGFTVTDIFVPISLRVSMDISKADREQRAREAEAERTKRAADFRRLSREVERNEDVEHEVADQRDPMKRVPHGHSPRHSEPPSPG